MSAARILHFHHPMPPPPPEEPPQDPKILDLTFEQIQRYAAHGTLPEPSEEDE